MTAGPPPMTLPTLFARFLRFGALAWGGPVAQIAMIRHELVDRERWIDPARFNRVLAVYQALPGPEAHELTVYFGYLARGRAGGALAGLGFMLPGFALMLAISAAYFEVGLRLQALAGAFAGMQAAVLALVARGVERIGRHALTSVLMWAIALAVLAAELAGVHFGVSLPTAGLVALLARRRRWLGAAGVLVAAAAVAVLVPAVRAEPALASLPAGAGPSPSIGRLLVTGLAAGLLTFGGAYTAIPLVRATAVGPQGWMATGTFLDGLAIGGVLPAPLIIFTTFVGYAGAGVWGALLVTAAVFLPAFAFTMVGFARLERAVDDPRLHDLLDGIAAGVVGLIAGTAMALTREAVGGPATAALAVAALLALLAGRGRWVTPAVVLGAAVLGAILRL